MSGGGGSDGSMDGIDGWASESRLKNVSPFVCFSWRLYARLLMYNEIVMTCERICLVTVIAEKY